MNGKKIEYGTNRSKTREYIEIMQAYIDDKPIQARRKGEDEWHTLKGHEIPLWNWEQCEYRIKEVKPRNSAKVKAQGLHKRMGYER